MHIGVKITCVLVVVGRNGRLPLGVRYSGPEVINGWFFFFSFPFFHDFLGDKCLGL